MKRFLKEWGLFLVIIFALLLPRLFIWFPVQVDGHSMDPTLANGEHLIVVRTTSIKHFDIVVAAEGNKNIVKRVIGMPGDTITYENDMLSINGKKSMKLISSNTRINLPRTNSKRLMPTISISKN